MKTLTHIFSRYTAIIWAFLKPLGAWGVFLVAAIDGSSIGLPVDATVIAYVLTDRPRFLLYVFMAAAGSTLGSIVVYVIGYKGGEELLRKRISPERFAKIHNAFDRHPFWSLMFPAMLPPPTPFKLFALAAAVSEMRFSHYLLAIFSGRFLRFLILGLLTLKYGPNVVHVLGELVRRHFYWVLIVIAAGIGVWLLVRKSQNGDPDTAKA
ncbi:MAG TPA: VTT domain-containing protein [Terriglobales bacterium]|nr:VTT domain-containing protein [Terriglobales bacterium]